MQPPPPPFRPAGWRTLFPLLAIVLSLLTTAVIGEGALRLAGYSPSNVNPLKSFHEFDPVLGWRGRKLYTARFKRPDFDVVVALDAARFRKQVNLEAKPNKLANEKARAATLFSITRALHIETIDLLPDFLACKSKTGETLTFKNDGHWNSTGHQAVAELLSEYLSTHPATNRGPGG